VGHPPAVDLARRAADDGRPRWPMQRSRRPHRERLDGVAAGLAEEVGRPDLGLAFQ